MFETFSLAGPVTSTVSETSGVSRTQCQGAQFSLNTEGETVITGLAHAHYYSSGPRPPVICGENAGHHMIVQARFKVIHNTYEYL